MGDNAPTRKVAAGGLAGAISLVVVWTLNTYFLPVEKPIPAEIGMSITTIFTFAVSWLTPSEVIVTKGE